MYKVRRECENGILDTIDIGTMDNLVLGDTLQDAHPRRLKETEADVCWNRLVETGRAAVESTAGSGRRRGVPG